MMPDGMVMERECVRDRRNREICFECCRLPRRRTGAIADVAGTRDGGRAREGDGV